MQRASPPPLPDAGAWAEELPADAGEGHKALVVVLARGSGPAVDAFDALQRVLHACRRVRDATLENKPPGGGGGSGGDDDDGATPAGGSEDIPADVILGCRDVVAETRPLYLDLSTFALQLPSDAQRLAVKNAGRGFKDALLRFVTSVKRAHFAGATPADVARVPAACDTLVSAARSLLALIAAPAVQNSPAAAAAAAVATANPEALAKAAAAVVEQDDPAGGRVNTATTTAVAEDVTTPPPPAPAPAPGAADGAEVVEDAPVAHTVVAARVLQSEPVKLDASGAAYGAAPFFLFAACPTPQCPVRMQFPPSAVRLRCTRCRAHFGRADLALFEPPPGFDLRSWVSDGSAAAALVSPPQLLPHERHIVPALIMICIEGLSTGTHAEAVGLFRTNAPNEEVASLVEPFLATAGKRADRLSARERKEVARATEALQRTRNPHLLAGTLKAFLRNLREPLVPFELYTPLVSQFPTDTDFRTKARHIRAQFESLQQWNRVTLSYLFAFLSFVVRLSAKNRMNVQNIARVFAPTLLREKVVVNLESVFLDCSKQEEVVSICIGNAAQVLALKSPRTFGSTGRSMSGTELSLKRPAAAAAAAVAAAAAAGRSPLAASGGAVAVSRLPPSPVPLPRARTVDTAARGGPRSLLLITAKFVSAQDMELQVPPSWRVKKMAKRIWERLDKVPSRLDLYVRDPASGEATKLDMRARVGELRLLAQVKVVFAVDPTKQQL